MMYDNFVQLSEFGGSHLKQTSDKSQSELDSGDVFEWGSVVLNKP